jgi:hypothetical protein
LIHETSEKLLLIILASTELNPIKRGEYVKRKEKPEEQTGPDQSGSVILLRRA